MNNTFDFDVFDYFDLRMYGTLTTYFIRYLLIISY